MDNRGSDTVLRVLLRIHDVCFSSRQWVFEGWSGVCRVYGQEEMVLCMKNGAAEGTVRSSRDST